MESWRYQVREGREEERRRRRERDQHGTRIIDEPEPEPEPMREPPEGFEGLWALNWRGIGNQVHHVDYHDRMFEVHAEAHVDIERYEDGGRTLILDGDPNQLETMLKDALSKLYELTERKGE